MAEPESWESIRSYGLLSTSALLDQYGFGGERREAIEGLHRPELITITADGKRDAVIRDQKPMDNHGLLRALHGTGMTPEDWYRCLNSKVFFWVSKQRLHKLLNASAYRNLEHDVLTINTESLVKEHCGSIVLSPINSGTVSGFFVVLRALAGNEWGLSFLLGGH